MRILKIDQMNALAWNNDQLLFLYIAVDRFSKLTLSLDWFLRHALLLDRFFVGEIDVYYLHSHPKQVKSPLKQVQYFVFTASYVRVIQIK